MNKWRTNEFGREKKGKIRPKGRKLWHNIEPTIIRWRTTEWAE